LSDDDASGGELDRVDTQMHFGGGNFDKSRSREANANPYGDSSRGPLDMGDAYRSRKDELDEMIHRKKMIKAEKAKTKEDQGKLIMFHLIFHFLLFFHSILACFANMWSLIYWLALFLLKKVEAFTTMDDSFKELSSLLQFRDKEEDRRQVVQARREGTQSKDDKEMDAWDSEMKVCWFRPHFHPHLPLFVTPSSFRQ
jgi:nucleolar protein 14